MLEAPSPKFHDHDVGEPVEVSVNCTGWPDRGDDGDHVKFATGGGGAVDTVFVMNVAVAPPLLDTAKLTENDAALLKV